MPIKKLLTAVTPLKKHIFNHVFNMHQSLRVQANISCNTVTVAEVLNNWTNIFIEKGIPEASPSAEYIIAHILGKKTLNGNCGSIILTTPQVKRVNTLCKRRLLRMPVQYILEEWDFHDLTLKMKAPVLIPRPETEELALLCSKSLTGINATKSNASHPRLLEIGSGSGALSIYLLKKFEHITITAVDKSKEACDLTQKNAQIHHVSNRLIMIYGDFKNQQIQRKLQSLGPYSMVISNPPYVCSHEMEALEPEIRFEDEDALHGGVDGLDLIKHILIKSQDLLIDKGHLWLEVGYLHPSIIKSFVTSQEPFDLQYHNTLKDFQGKNRFCHLLKTDSLKKTTQDTAI